MTLAFTFPIKDAWVIVADKKVISKLETSESSEEIKMISDDKIKIEDLEHGITFVGAGEDGYLEKIMDAINKSDNFNDFKDNVWNKMGQVYGSLHSTVQKKEEFLIINKESQEAFKIDTRLIEENNPTKGIFALSGTYLERNFIGSFDEKPHKGILKIRIASFRELLFEEINNLFYNSCNDILSTFSIDYLKEVGHPSIQGSAIWIISKDVVRKVFTLPKNNYDYEVKEE